MSKLRTLYEKHRLTTLTLLVLQAAFLILFGFFVRYDEQLAMPSILSTKRIDQASITTFLATHAPTFSQSQALLTNLSMSSTQTDAATLSTTGNLSFSTQVSTSAAANGNSSTAPVTVIPPFTNSPGAAALVQDEGRNGSESVEKKITIEEINSHVTTFYAMFQDIHVMMFIGFGFLMTFLKKYGYSSVGFNFLVGAFVLQWATLTAGWILHWDPIERVMRVNMETLINADFAAATILISFGAVLGTISGLQLIIMALIEVVAFQANELFVFDFLQATDVGDSMVVHTFGAYFGLAVSWINYRKEVKEAQDKEGSVYHSDIFSMIGTIFLWLFWPSFNAATAVDEGRLRAVINTYYSLTASTVVSFAISALVHKDKFNMVHIQNSTLAGGVAVGTLADFIIQPWGAILVGSVAGVVSVLGFRYLTPFLNKRLKLHDTCGVHNLHGMPGLISGLGSVLAAGLATEELYGDGLSKMFKDPHRSRNQLAGFQAAATFVSLGMGLVCGAITGVILRIPMWNLPSTDEIFDDEQSWLLPKDDDEDELMNGRAGKYVPNNTNSIEMPNIRNRDNYENA